jgi:hypothetical protein
MSKILEKEYDNLSSSDLANLIKLAYFLNTLGIAAADTYVLWKDYVARLETENYAKPYISG